MIAELGRDERAVVHHVRRDGADFALTLLAARPSPAPVVAALRRDAARLAMVGHPGLPLVREVGVLGTCPYTVADLVPGRPLADLLADGPLPADAVRALAADLAGIRAALRCRGVAPGDLTPHSVVVDPDGVAHLVDVGLGAPYGARPAEGGSGDPWPLGALLFRCLTGRPPSRADDVPEVMRRYGLAGIVEQVAARPPMPDDTDPPLCGRDVELATLADRWLRARRGAGGAALISGQAGIGTSRLAREVAACVRAGRGVVLQAACSPGDPPFRTLGAALGDPARWGAAPGADQAEITEILARLARDSGGLLLHLDSVQWLDPGSLRVIRLLSGRLAALPLLVLATARSGAEDAAGVAIVRAALGASLDSELALGPLDVEGVTELIGALLPGPGGRASLPVGPLERLVRRIVPAGGGSPSAVQEYLQAAVDAGLLYPGWVGWEFDEAGS